MGFHFTIDDIRQMERPVIVCLCGSTRFKEAFVDANRKETMNGKIVVGPGLFGHAGDLTPEMCEKGHPVKEMLDDLHKRKIDISDEILVINVDGYVGESTRSEIEYAIKNEVAISWLEPSNLPEWF